MKRKQVPTVKDKDSRTEAWTLARRLQDETKPSRNDVQKLRQLISTSAPELRAPNHEAHDNLRRQMVEKVCGNGFTQAELLAQCDNLKNELGGAQAPPIEQLLIDQILTARLHLLFAEATYSQKILNEQKISLRFGEYLDSRITTAQTRYIRAIEALARVRKLARNTPALQINVAANGGQQVNVHGDVKR